MMRKRNKEEFLTYRHAFFRSLESCREELIRSNVISTTRTCPKCNYIAYLVIYKVGEEKQLFYQCLEYDCRVKQSIVKGNKLSMDNYLFLLFTILIRCTFEQAKLLAGVSREAYDSASELLREKLRSLTVNNSSGGCKVNLRSRRSVKEVFYKIIRLILNNR